jgi:hypothetical protein
VKFSIKPYWAYSSAWGTIFVRTAQLNFFLKLCLFALYITMLANKLAYGNHFSLLYSWYVTCWSCIQLHGNACFSLINWSFIWMWIVLVCVWWCVDLCGGYVWMSWIFFRYFIKNSNGDNSQGLMVHVTPYTRTAPTLKSK